MMFISSIPPLNESNYNVWREKLEIALALSDNNLALISPCPTEPKDPMRAEKKTDAAFATRQRDHASVRMKYDLNRAKRDSSNRKCLMVIKGSIKDLIRGSIPEYTIATEYLKKVESQFTGSSKAYASTLIKKLVSEKYTGGGIREHILKMSNMASKLKPMEMGLKDEFLIHLIFASLAKEYKTFVVNYNLQPDKWDIKKLIAMCVQEEERLKSSHGDSINHVNSSKQQGKAPQKDHHQKSNYVQVDKDTCRWCHKTGHYQKNCPDFLKHLMRKGEDIITFIDESLHTKFVETRHAVFLENDIVRGSMVAREINLEEKRVYVSTPMVQEPFFSLPVATAPTVPDTIVTTPVVNSPVATINEHEEPVF
ncbi:uncharacterized protein [Miscanthus floridulus]|uniref:uncharacterized protein n=1 Tax=Miscanthus floridulus TaxID=154761 RepID=UPI00345AAD13